MKVIVIGAGLSGAAVANSLARRGAQVTVLDTAPHPAAGASSLPAGLMAPHVSKDDNLTSQLVRLGLACTTREAQRLLRQGVDWQPCGALYIPFKPGKADLWHSEAAWVKPAALVRAWLAAPGISFVGNARVGSIQFAGTPDAPLWLVHGSHGPGHPYPDGFVADSNQPTTLAATRASTKDTATTTLLASAPTVVLASATGTQTILHPLPHQGGKKLALHTVAGQVIFGVWSQAWQHASPVQNAAHHAVNGNGHYIANIPVDAEQQERMWLSGSTYEHPADHGASNKYTTPSTTPAGIAANCARLSQLLAAAAPLLVAAQASGQLQAWAGLRCTTADRLPAVGALDANALPGLYASVGMGSRGLSFAALAGEHIAQLIAAQRALKTSVEFTHLPQALQTAISPSRLFYY